MEFIRRKDALKAMRKLDRRGYAQPFSLRFVTYDRARRTGGRIVDVPWAVLNTAEQARVEEIEKMGKGKQPRHFVNQTRNIKLKDGEIRKVHIQLITMFNGMRVI